MFNNCTQVSYLHWCNNPVWQPHCLFSSIETNVKWVASWKWLLSFFISTLTIGTYHESCIDFTHQGRWTWRKVWPLTFNQGERQTEACVSTSLLAPLTPSTLQLCASFLPLAYSFTQGQLLYFHRFQRPLSVPTVMVPVFKIRQALHSTCHR